MPIVDSLAMFPGPRGFGRCPSIGSTFLSLVSFPADLRATLLAMAPDEPAAEFRSELRAWLASELTPDGDRGGQAWPRRRLARRVAGLEPAAGRRRLGRAGVADRARWPRRRPRRAARLPRGDEHVGGTRADQRDRRVQHRPGDHALRHRRAEGPLPPADAAGRRDLVAGHVRARRRLRPGLAAVQRGGRRRRLRDQRPEDVEQPRPPRRVVPAVRPHRPGVAQAQGHQLPAGRPADAGHRGPSAHAP